MAVVGNAMYVTGGYSKDKVFVADAWMLDLASLDRSPTQQASPSWDCLPV